ncbi:MAG: hypothetical protein OXE50_16420 [Chloroflexi bacterium]|nr:hypothetical protein [Chloroflexota bacterium]
MMDDEIEDALDDLNFHVEKSMRYHQRIRGFYDFTHKLFMFVIIISGSSALIGRPVVFAITASILAALNLVWSPSQQARRHEILFQRFSDLAIELRSGMSSEDNLRAWRKQREIIEKDESPVFHALEADCDNEVRHAWGRTEELVKIGYWTRVTMYILRHTNKTPFKTYLTKNQADTDKTQEVHGT